MLAGLKAIGFLAAYLAFAILSVVVAGMLIFSAWNWFIVPVSGAREISFSEGVGLYVVLGILIQFGSVTRLSFADIPDDDTGRWAWLMLRRVTKFGVLYPLLELAVAWIWHTFFMPNGFLG